MLRKGNATEWPASTETLNLRTEHLRTEQLTIRQRVATLPDSDIDAAIFTAFHHEA
jgi:hypothetical protein